MKAREQVMVNPDCGGRPPTPRYPLLALIGALAAAACQGTAAQAATTKLTLAISGLSEGKLPIYVAGDQGFFKAAGLSLDILEFRSGTEAVQTFVGGSADFCICAADHEVILRGRGLDVKLISGLDAHYPNALVAKSTSAASDIAALKGRKIGITAPGSSTDNLLRWALARAGLDAARDVDIVSVGTGLAMRAAIESGAIDAGILGNAEIIEAQRDGRALKVIVDWRTTEAAALNVIARQKWIDQNRDVAHAFVQAVAKGAKLIQADHRAAVAGVRQIFPEKDAGFVEALTSSSIERLSKDGSISPIGFANTVEIIRQSDPALQPVKLEDVNLQPELVR